MNWWLVLGSSANPAVHAQPATPSMAECESLQLVKQDTATQRLHIYAICLYQAFYRAVPV